MRNPDSVQLLRSLFAALPDVNAFFLAKLVKQNPTYSQTSLQQLVVTFRQHPKGGYGMERICIFCGGSESETWEEHILLSNACQITWTHSR